MKITYVHYCSALFLTLHSMTHTYSYLPDEMSLSDTLLINAHNSPQSFAYSWRYAQQKGTLRNQWKAGARGMKINFHWRKPLSFTEHIGTLIQKKTEASKNNLLSLPEERGIREWFNKAEEKAIDAMHYVSGKFVPKENNNKPFIALGHEPDGASNCMLSAYLQKSNEVDTALSYFTEFAKIMKENPNDIAIIIIEDYLDRRSDQNGTNNYSDETIQKELDGLIEQSGLAQYALKLDPKYWAQGGRTAEKWPTVGELRNSNKRLILLTDRYNHAVQSPYLNPYNSETFRRSHWAYNWEADMAKTCKLLYESNATMFIITHGAEVSLQEGSIPSAVLYLLRKFGFKPATPDGAAIKGIDYKILNNEKNIRQRIADCQKKSCLTPVSVIGLDFVEEGNVYETIKKINRERAQAFGLKLKE